MSALLAAETAPAVRAVDGDRPLRILYLSDVFFPRVNGVSTSIDSFRHELARLGHVVEVMAPRYGNEPDTPGIVRLPARRVPLDPEDRMLHGRAVLRLSPTLAGRFDLVHVQTPFVAHWAGVRLARRLGLPLLLTYHTHFEEYLHHYLPFLPRAPLRALARAASRRQCHQAAAAVVPSSAFHQVLRSYGVRSPLTVLPTGLPESALVEGDGAAFRRRHGIAPGRPVILNVGRMAHEKNLPFLLEVAAAVRQRRPDLLLVMTGEGPARRSLERRAAELGIADAVRWVGYLDRERELLDCYRAADVFVFASRTETQGLVLLEAMAQRLPVVSTAVLGTRDVLAAGQGCLTSSEQVHPFAARVLQLLDDPHLRAQVGVAGRAHVRECWSAAACAKRLATLYAEVVHTGAPVSAGNTATSPVPLSASAVATANHVRATNT
ncbi:MAG TPA: glycosyltransferase [Thermoanaerobaculia bacterium]|nr:glycosyltransferase [Thermoanaerobaculia bacterium]